jgi:hypothetical protein
MIRKNYSLAQERRSLERLQQARVQKRQKHAHLQAKLERADPHKMHAQIRSLERRASEGPLAPRDQQFLQRLREEWQFMVANGLHAAAVSEIEERLRAAEARRQRDAAKLWGRQLVYFNPELNPLGKVPPGMPNVRTSDRGKLGARYPDDAELEALGVALPAGPPPRFYKLVQNAQQSASVEGKAQGLAMVPATLRKRRKVQPGNYQRDLGALDALDALDYAESAAAGVETD